MRGCSCDGRERSRKILCKKVRWVTASFINKGIRVGKFSGGK
jgi:hypothetical protein